MKRLLILVGILLLITSVSAASPVSHFYMTAIFGLSGFMNSISMDTFGTPAGSQTNYNIPVLLTTSSLSENLNTLDQGNIVTDNFTHWLKAAMPIRRYNTTQQPVLGTNTSNLWESEQVNDQHFLADGDYIRMYYMGTDDPISTVTGIGIASVSVSDFLQYGDRAIWTTEAPILETEGITYRMGSIIKFTNVSSPTGVTYYLYTGEQNPGGTPIMYICQYTGTTYNNFTKISNNLVSLAGDETYNQIPAVIKENSTSWLMYYHAALNSGGWAYDVATSTNGLNWTRQGRVLTNGGQTWSAGKLEHVSAMKVGNTYVITYEGAVVGLSQWATGIAYSTNPIGTFTEYSGNPVLSGDGSDLALPSYAHASTPTWLKVGNKWYYSISGNQHVSEWNHNWVNEIYPVNLPMIQVSGVKSDFSDVRFSQDLITSKQQYRSEYDSGNWAKYYVQLNTGKPVYDSVNVAAASNGATAIASSVEGGSSVNNAIDENYTTEWISNNERTGAWLQVNLSEATNIGKIQLCSGLTYGDGIMSGHIVFSNGSIERYGTLPSPGGATSCRNVEFQPRNVTWFRVIVDSPFVASTSPGYTDVRAYEWLSGAYISQTKMYYGNANATDTSNSSIMDSPPSAYPEPYFILEG